MRKICVALALLLIAGCKKDQSLQGGVKVEVKTLGFTPGCLTVTATDSTGKSNTVTLDGGFTRDGVKTLAVLGSGVWGPDLTVSAVAKELSCDGATVARNTGKVTLPKTGVAQLPLELDAVDRDGDGYVSDTQGNGLSGTDCDDDPDGGATVHPGAAEVCDGIDNNCNKQIDEGVMNTFYVDLDHDGFGEADSGVQRCTGGPGLADNGDDCDDSRADVHPKDGGETACDGINDDCKGVADDTFLVNQACTAPDGGCAGTYVCTPDQKGSYCQTSSSYYVDNDGDGHGSGPPLAICPSATGYATVGDDCNDDPLDGGAVSYPGHPEVCDGFDNNCNNQVDEGLLITFYRDQDGDGVGTSADRDAGCSVPAGYVPASNGDDCNDDPADGGARQYPGNTEICDGIDNNCDGNIDEGLLSTYFRDQDGDKVGAPDASVQGCAEPAGYVLADAGSDCDDGDPYTYPGAPEICDQKDNSCAGYGIDDAGSCTGAAWAGSTLGSGVNWNSASAYGVGEVWLAGKGSAGTSQVYLQSVPDAGFVSEGAACESLTPIGVPSSAWYSAWADGRTKDVYVGGDSTVGGTVAQVEPDGGCAVMFDTLDPVHAVVGFPLSDGGVDLWAATSNGYLSHNGSNDLTSSGVVFNAIHGTSASLMAAAGATSTPVPKLFLRIGSTWTDQNVESLGSMPTNTQLNGVWVLDAKHIYAVGTKGVFLWFDGTKWSLNTTAGGAVSLNAVTAFGASDVYVVGSDKKVRRWTGTGWDVLNASLAAHPLNSITGASPADLWSVGDTQTLFHWHEP